VAPVAPTFHFMPPRSSLVPAAETASASLTTEPVGVARRKRRRLGKRAAAAPAKRVTDRLNANHEGANGMRCGYVIELARERRGLLTCATCR
jgi:hypothetical protein